MFNTRFISSIIALAILFLVIWADANIEGIFGIALFIVSVLAIDEFYSVFPNIKQKRAKILGYLFCMPLILLAIGNNFEATGNYLIASKVIHYISFAIFLLIAILFLITIFFKKKFVFNNKIINVLGIIYVPFLLSFIINTRNFDNGIYYVWIIFIGAWATDTCAYFAGKFFGKRKLIPSISPQKTVEGALGGIIGCTVGSFIFGKIVLLNGFIDVAIYHFIVIGLLNGVIAQFGDLSASVIKRRVNIKDFGKIMPGHGGVLDRFDSVLFIAPFVYYYVFFIVLGKV